MNTVRRLDIGVKLLVTLTSNGLPFDVSSASLIQFLFKKPDQSVLTTTGSWNTTGTDGNVQYTSIANDFDQIGLWKYQVHIVMPGETLTSTQSSFRVQDSIGL